MNIILVSGKLSRARTVTLTGAHLAWTAAGICAVVVALAVALQVLTLRFAATVNHPALNALIQAAGQEQHVRQETYLRDSLNAINDSYAYGGPVYLQLTGYEEVQASGLQLTRSPGKNIVYTGSVLLILGVFAMFYIRERRIWLLVKPQAGQVLLAMSGNRKTMDFEKEFERHRQQLADLLRG